jgi:hypothetical protein
MIKHATLLLSVTRTRSFLEVRSRAGWLVISLVCCATSNSLAAPPAIQFVGAVNGFGLKQINADGTPLLVDDAAGFYLIGSGTGADNRNNIASFVKGNDGTMQSMNGDKVVSIPYSFELKANPKDKTRIDFAISLGPATVPLATVSMPLDGHRGLFTHYRYDGATERGNFDGNPPGYTPPGREEYRIKFAPGKPRWGEMIGPKYTVRVTLTSHSRPMSLAFVDAPSLSTGVRNVEFGFGAMKPCERATAAGFIQVMNSESAPSR